MNLRVVSHPILPALLIGLAACSPDASERSSIPPAAAQASHASAPEGKIQLVARNARPTRAADERLFEEVPASHSGVTFLPDFEPVLTDMPMMRLNAGGGIATGDLTGDGKCDFFVTSPKGGGVLYENLGGWKFRDITAAAGLSDPSHWGTGVQIVDVDADGDLDLFVCGFRSPNRLWINDGTGKFADRASQWGLDADRASMTMAWADVDLDGRLDGYLATTGYPPGPAQKFRVNMVRQGGRDVPRIPPELEEYWELLYLPGDRARNVPAAQKDHLFIQGDGRFTDLTSSSGITGPWFTLSAVWWDYDSDGFPDCYVSNDYFGPDRLYRNRGNRTFEDTLKATLPHTPWFSMGADIGDLNNDGLMDLLTSDMAATSHYRDKVMMGNMEDSGWFLDWAEPRQYMRNALFINTGTGRMLETAFASNLAGTDWTWTPRLEDYDNDGWVDVYLTNGVLRDMMNSDLNQQSDRQFAAGSREMAEFWRALPMRKERNLAFRNAGDLRFESVGSLWGLDHEGVSFGAATADFDDDGALDLVVANVDVPVGLYRNRAGGASLQVRLVGTTSNSQGIGATVTASVEGGSTQTRYVTVTRGFLSASDPILHFGLGKAERVDRLTVRWPSGCEQSFTDLPVNHLAIVTEGGPVRSTPPPPPDPMFRPSDVLNMMVHAENPFDDFKREPLLPNRMSVGGPGQAWGDLDADGDDDLWLGGAAGQPGQLARREAAGFELITSPALQADKYSEDMGGVWFDADGDGDQDLYVVSGGNEFQENDILYADRLYLNDGRGTLTPAPAGTLPPDRFSGSVVAAADFDRDGDLDLFVGGRQVAGQYPKPPPSRLLRNEHGKFNALPMDAGMITSALWTDADNDGWLDLLLTLDWGSPRLYRNQAGTLKDHSAEAGLDPLLGWWNGVAASDFDHDGDIDYVITNFGLNTKYKANPEKPELLFAGDFDDSGRLQLVEAKYEGDVLLPRRGLSCSSMAMPFIRSKLPTFHNFASATLKDVYPPEKLARSLQLKVVELQSGVLLNDGQARLAFHPLPRSAQFAPAFGVVAADLTGDGHPDIALTHNFFGPQRETGRMDGGLGLLLAGDGMGGFEEVPARESGIVVPEDARSLALADVDANGAPDLVFGLNNAPVRTLLRQPNPDFLKLRLRGNESFRPVAGSRVTVRSGDLPPQTAELSSAGGYLTGGPQELWFSCRGSAEVIVRWPDGETTSQQVWGPAAVIER